MAKAYSCFSNRQFNIFMRHKEIGVGTKYQWVWISTLVFVGYKYSYTPAKYWHFNKNFKNNVFESLQIKDFQCCYITFYTGGMAYKRCPIIFNIEVTNWTKRCGMQELHRAFYAEMRGMVEETLKWAERVACVGKNVADCSLNEREISNAEETVQTFKPHASCERRPKIFSVIDPLHTSTRWVRQL